MRVDNTPFYEAQNRYLQDRNKKDWDFMFQYVYKVCISEAKQRCVGIHVRELKEKALNACCDVMEHYLKNPEYKIGKLENVAYFPVLKAMCRPEIKLQDKIGSIDGHIEAKGETGFDPNYFQRLYANIKKPKVKPPTAKEKDIIFNGIDWKQPELFEEI